MKEFKFLKLQDDTDQWREVFMDKTPWLGGNAFSVKGSVSTKNPIPDGTYKFADLRELTVEDGKVKKIRTYSEVIVENALGDFRTELSEMNQKFEALTEAIVELAKAKN